MERSTEIVRFLQREGVNVVANSGHPGAVKTALGQNFFEKGTTGKNSLTTSLLPAEYKIASSKNIREFCTPNNTLTT